MKNGYVRFHIKAGRDLKETLKKLGDGHLSIAVNTIFREGFHLLEKKECTLEKFELPDEEEQDEDLYILMEEKHKGKLFQIQSHFRLRSKASVLRFLLRIYIAKLEKSNKKRLTRSLKRSRVSWEHEKARHGIWDKKKRVEDKREYMTCNYDHDFKLCSILFFTPRSSCKEKIIQCV